MRATVPSPVRVSDPLPLGDVPLAPAALTGVPEAQLARSMVDQLRSTDPATSAEALRFLRRAFPHSPLTVRVAALAALMRR
jgi:hypothetical protein